MSKTLLKISAYTTGNLGADRHVDKIFAKKFNENNAMGQIYTLIDLAIKGRTQPHLQTDSSSQFIFQHFAILPWPFPSI